MSAGPAMLPAPVQSLGPLPPQNTDAEEAVLGSLFMSAESISQVVGFLKPGDFYRERNGAIYGAMVALYERREPIDYTTVADELGRRNELEQVGGWVYLAKLLQAVPTSLHIEQYARIVERTSVMRRLLSASGKIAGLAYDDNGDVEATLARAERYLLDVSERRASRDFLSLAQVLDEYLDQAQAAQAAEQSKERHGVPTGYIDLDHLLGGFQRSDLLILAARPGMGKTGLALNIAANASLTYRARVAVFSLEMSREQLAGRLLSAESGVEAQRIRLGRLNETDSLRVSHALGVLYEAPIYVDDTSTCTILELRAKARRLHASGALDLIIVDYLQLLSGSRGSENRVQEISEISRSLKALARDLNVPVLALSQLSRAVEQRSPHIPQLSDLRESGSIENDADVVLFIYRDDYYNRDSEKRGIADLLVAKHRNGPTGQVSLLFNTSTTKFVDLEAFRA